MLRFFLKDGNNMQYVMFGLYDGHGGNGTSLKLANELHIVIHQVWYTFLIFIHYIYNVMYLLAVFIRIVTFILIHQFFFLIVLYKVIK